MTTITRTSDSATTTPTLVDGYETTLEGTNILHRLADGGLGVSLMRHLPRAGTLNLFFAGRSDAWAAVALFTAAVDTFTLSDTDVPEIDMFFTAGDVSPALEDRTRKLWIVSVEYQEILT